MQIIIRNHYEEEQTVDKILARSELNLTFSLQEHISAVEDLFILLTEAF